jgi:flagellar basal body-associated protein FliL
VKGKLKFVIPLVVLLVLGGAYKAVLAKPGDGAKPKVDGVVYVLPKEFIVNLADSRFAKLSVALVLPKDEAPAANESGGATPPEGYGALEQEAAVRAVITDTVTDASMQDLTDRKRRRRLRDEVLKQIRAHTDVKPTDVLFTDVAVQ